MKAFWPRKDIEPREGQSVILETAFSRSEEWDVLVIEAPTAWGKSLCEHAFLRWAHKALGMKGMLLASNNMLVDQLSSGQHLATLSRKSSYSCTQATGISCEQAHKKEKGYCKGCPYVKDLRRIRAVPYGVMSYYMYMAHKFKLPFLVFDEAHQIRPMLQDLASKTIWQREYRFPDNMPPTVGAMRGWLKTCPGYSAGFPYDEKLRLLHATLESPEPSYLIEKTESLLRGRIEACIKLIPLDVKETAGLLWPRAKKLVLMSATISSVEIEELGLMDRRVLYLKAPSPIDVSRRPIVFYPLGSASGRNWNNYLPTLKEFIEKKREEHRGTKGLIHTTYNMARELRRMLPEGPYMFHDASNKQKVFEEWQQSEEGVLFACGMHEGLDLVGEEYGWQVLAKVPWQNLGDTAVRWKLEHFPRSYEWEAIKLSAQAAGRICRTPEDRGVTYITDSSWARIKDSDLVPGWLKEAYV